MKFDTQDQEAAYAIWLKAKLATTLVVAPHDDVEQRMAELAAREMKFK